VPGGRLARGEPHGRDRRQPERQKRGKGGASIDPSGFDAGKKVQGKSRHILVDTQSLLMHAVLRASDIQDRDGGALVMATLFRMRLQALFEFSPFNACSILITVGQDRR